MALFSKKRTLEEKICQIADARKRQEEVSSMLHKVEIKNSITKNDERNSSQGIITSKPSSTNIKEFHLTKKQIGYTSSGIEKNINFPTEGREEIPDPMQIFKSHYQAEEVSGGGDSSGKINSLVDEAAHALIQQS